MSSLPVSASGEVIGVSPNKGTQAGGTDISISGQGFVGRPEFSWGASVGTTDYDSASAMTIDASGNVYTAGNTNGYYNIDKPTSVFKKHSANGNLLWDKTFSTQTTTNTAVKIGDIATDSGENVYISGVLAGSVNFGSDNATGADIILTSQTSNSSYLSEMFLVKYNSAGNVLTAKLFSSTSGWIEEGARLVVDSNNNLFLSGSFSGSINFGNHSVTSGSWNSDFYLLKMDSQMNSLWSKTTSGVAGTYPRLVDLELDGQGNPLLSGSFTGKVNFGDTTLISAANPNYSNSYYSEAFMAKYDISGNLVFAKQTTGNNSNSNYRVIDNVATDDSGNIYAVGSCIGNTQLASTTLNCSTVNSGDGDMFLAGYTSTGTLNWLKKTSGTADYLRTHGFGDRYGLAIHPNGTLYVSGVLWGSKSINLSDSLSLASFNTYGKDVFIAQYDTSGNALRGRTVGTLSSDETTKELKIDSNRRVYLFGEYNYSTNLDSVALPDLKTAGTNATTLTDLYLARLSETDTLTVKIGNNPCLNTVLVSSSQITCTTPAGVPGQVDVTVQNGDGSTLTLSNGFTYTSLFSFSNWVSDSTVTTTRPYQLVAFEDKFYQSYVAENNRIYTRYTSSTDVYQTPASGWSAWETSSDAYEKTFLPVTMTTFNGEIYHTHIGSPDPAGRQKIYTRMSDNGSLWTTWGKGSDPYEDTKLPIGMTSFTVNGTETLFQVHVGVPDSTGRQKIYTRSSTDGIAWSNWTKGPDPYEDTKLPVKIAAFNGKLYQVHVGTDNKIYTRSSNDGVSWSNWTKGSDPYEFTNSTVEIQAAGGKLYEVHKGSDNNIYTRVSSDGTTWSVWSNNGGTTNLSISMTEFDGRLYQGMVGTDSKVYWRRLE